MFPLDILKSHMYSCVVFPLTILIVNGLSSEQFPPQKGLYASGVERAKACSSNVIDCLP